MAVNRGKKFESVIEECFSAVSDVSVIRLHDQTMGYLGGQNPCDFLIYHKPYLYAIECKSVHGNTLSIYSKPKPDKRGVLHGFYGNITDTQWNGLLEMSQVRGVFAGVIVWFIDHNETVFLDINLLKRWRDAGHKSIHSYPEWLECVEKKTDWCYLDGKKKRVFFDYAAEKFLYDMEGEEKWTANSIKVPYEKIKR